MVRDILSNLIITDVVAAYDMYSTPGGIRSMAERPNWAILIKYEGETLYAANEKHFVADANHIMLLPKGATYDVECTQAGHFALIEFICEYTSPEPICISTKDGKAIWNQFKELEYRRNLKRDMHKIESIKNVYLIILSLAKSISEKYSPNHKLKRIQPAIDYISQNFTQSISNDKLAELVSMSPSHFRNAFTQAVGMPPITYAKQMRIEKAKELLKSDHEKLSDIAVSLGYSSLFDFSRDFKKHIGISPSKYQKS